MLVTEEEASVLFILCCHCIDMMDDSIYQQQGGTVISYDFTTSVQVEEVIRGLDFGSGSKVYGSPFYKGDCIQWVGCLVNF